LETDMLLGLGMIGFGILLALALIVLGIRGQFIKMDQIHRERMKALEMGVLPEVLRARAETARARAAGTVGVVVPLLMAGAATGGTSLVLTWGEASWRLTVLCVIWGVCGVVSLVAVTTSLEALRRGSRPRAKEKPTTEAEPPPIPPTSFQERRLPP
jgi:hypothetical protein